MVQIDALTALENALKADKQEANHEAYCYQTCKIARAANHGDTVQHHR